MKFKLSDSKIFFTLIQDQSLTNINKLEGTSQITEKAKRCILTHACTIQIIDNHLYIESLDTTGYFSPRKLQSFFTKRFIKTILNEFDPEIISVFSKPKKEFIFRNSHKNPKKNILKPADLFNYWLRLFENIQREGLEGNYNTCKANIEFQIKKKCKNDGNKCKPTNDNHNSTNENHNNTHKYELLVYSPFYEKKSYPYNSLQEIVFFDDDPKKKLIHSLKVNYPVDDESDGPIKEDSNNEDDKTKENIPYLKETEPLIDINSFYNLLLQRYDMSKGGLLYLRNLQWNGKEGNNTRHVINLENDKNPIDYLRNSDFGSFKSAIKNTDNFLNKFSHFEAFSDGGEFEEFDEIMVFSEIQKQKIHVSEEKENIVVLKTRRKKI